jgi:hypothetical protein
MHLIDGTEWIQDFHVKFLRKFVKNRMAYLEFVSFNDRVVWLKACYKEFEKHLEPSDWPFQWQEGLVYSDLSLRQRVCKSLS